MTLGQRLKNTASASPGRTALAFGRKRYSYKEIDALTDSFASGVAGLGACSGGKVAILLPNCPEFVIAYFGAVKAGAVAVPLNTFLAAPELVHILKDSGADVLVYSPEFSERVKAIRLAPGGPRHFISTGPDTLMTAGLEDVIETGRKSGVSRLPEPADDDPAAVLYTSGTTGMPKGVILTHKNLLSNITSCAEAYKILRKDRFLLFLPMFHAFTSLVCVLLPLCLGCRIIILPSVRPFSRVIKTIIFGGVTIFVAIPPIYSILAMKKFPRIILRILPLRLCVSGAAPLPKEALDRFSKNYPFPLLEGYGLTEASPVVSCNPLDGIRKAGSVGLPLPGVEVKILSDEGIELPTGEVGEITVRGENVMKGYLNDEHMTEEAIRDGWLRTGDLGYIDKDGYVFIVDRKKDLILMHGMNIYPREVEDALYLHPAVRQAAVVGVPDPMHGEIPKAFLSLREGASLTEKELKIFLRGRIAAYKIPRQVEFMDSLPVNPTGKIMKAELRKCKNFP